MVQCLRAFYAVRGKGHVKSAKEFFGETNNWNETGYITTDGTKLDFSGRHEGAPGGQLGEGATAVSGAELCERQFQSTPPGRLEKILLRLKKTAISIHAPGATAEEGSGANDISIHAPAKGATAGVTFPAPARPGANDISIHAPASDRDGDPRVRSLMPARGDFNPRPRAGGDAVM